MAQQLGSFEKVLRLGEGRRVKRLAEQSAYIGTLEPEFEALSDAELVGKTAEFRQRIENGEPVDELVFEAFAAVREAFKRAMGAVYGFMTDSLILNLVRRTIGTRDHQDTDPKRTSA